ncbi:MAG: hypothetical protein KC572_04015 [Gammaproteobacteria bacterium]|nr:hypothetical protein [Gammaproteobacteria bacterium]
MNRLTRMLCTGSVALTILTACGEPPSAPEEELRAWVAAGVEAAEKKERRGLVGMISESYADSRGNERSDIENLLRIYFLRQNNITLLPNIDEVVVYGDTAATIVMTVGMAGTNDGVLGFSADAYRFELELEKDGEWQLIAARWGEVGDEIK